MSDLRGDCMAWYCPTCGVWVGGGMSKCRNGHDRPRWPLWWTDVRKASDEVTLRDRLRAVARRLL